MEDTIKAMLPKIEKRLNDFSYDDAAIMGRNEIVREVHALVPAIIEKVYEDLRGKIEEMYQDEHPVDCIDGVTPVETYGYEETHNGALKMVLSLLTTKK